MIEANLRSFFMSEIKVRRITKTKHGYRVRFIYPAWVAELLKKNTYSLSFNFQDFKNERQCFDAAVQHRNMMEVTFNLIVSEWDADAGISRVERWMNDRNRPLCGWKASWREGEPGQRKNKSKTFTFVYGEQDSEAQAKKKAQEHRLKMILLHHDPDCYRTKR